MYFDDSAAMSGMPRPSSLRKLYSENWLCRATGANARVAAVVFVAQAPDEGVRLVFLVIQSREVTREAAPGVTAGDFGYLRRTADTSNPRTCENY